MDIKIQADEFNEVQFDKAYGHAKKLLNSKHSSCAKVYSGYGITLKKKKDTVNAIIKKKGEK